MRLQTIFKLCVTIAIVGCGGGVEGTGADQASLNPSTRIDELSTPQIKAACNTIRRQAFDEIASVNQCTYLALTEPYYYYYLGSQNVTVPEPDYSTPEHAAAVCEVGKANCERHYSEASFEERCQAKNDGHCILQSDDFRKKCHASLSVLLGCVQDNLDAARVHNELAQCKDEFDYQRSINDEIRVSQGEIRPDQAFVFDPYPPFHSAACEQLEHECEGTGVISFSECDPEFI